MRQLERALASERDESLDSDPSTKTLLLEVTQGGKGEAGAEASNADVRQLAGARAALCGANAAAPFLALCDGDFLRETLGQPRHAASASPVASAVASPVASAPKRRMPPQAAAGAFLGARVDDDADADAMSDADAEADSAAKVDAAAESV